MLSLGLVNYCLLRTQSKNECAAAAETTNEANQYKRNALEKRAFVLQYPANEPCEDRFNCYQFKNQNAYYAAVFDGHGGWQVSDYAMRQMHVYLDEELKSAKSEADVKRAISKAFGRVEQDWIDLAKTAFDKGFPKVAYVGSCALVAVVKDNKLYIANAGDSKAVLLRKKEDGSYTYIKASTTFNANKKYE